MERVKFPPLENDELKAMLYEIAPEFKVKVFEETGDVDFGYEIPGKARYRANFFNQKNGVAAVFRQIPSKILTAEQLGLPPIVKRFAGLHKGLVLVTGPTGSGKSTTLAAIVDHANKTRQDHVITIRSGRMRWTVEGESLDAEPGDVIVTPAGVSHSYRVLGDEDATVVCVDAPVRPRD